ncbi:MAG: hypothetical protein N2169_03410 [bacterium]|nr:hypothetical protein [bacterium]
MSRMIDILEFEIGVRRINEKKKKGYENELSSTSNSNHKVGFFEGIVSLIFCYWLFPLISYTILYQVFSCFGLQSYTSYIFGGAVFLVLVFSLALYVNTFMKEKSFRWDDLVGFLFLPSLSGFILLILLVLLFIGILIGIVYFLYILGKNLVSLWIRDV